MKISVIIPVFNADGYLEQAVKSALIQPETAEVILIEDGSTDSSLAICEELERQSNKVRLLRHTGGGNRGAGPSRNLGILNAKYDYIAFLDADDFYLPGRFETASRIFAQNPRAEGVYGATGVHFETESARQAWLDSPLHKGQKITTMKELIPPDRLFHALASESGMGVFHTNAIVVRRSLFEKTGLFDEALSLHQDMVMWIKMAAMGNLVGGSISKPVARRRVHDNNRILKLPKGFSPQIKKMDDILIKWASEVGLPRKKVNLLHYKKWRNCLYDYDLWKRAKIESDSGRLTVQVRRKAIFLIARLFNSPSLLFSLHFYRFFLNGLFRITWRG